MKLLLFSDLHSDFSGASKLVELSRKVDVVVGAGAVVTKDITESGIYVGNPAKKLRDI